VLTRLQRELLASAIDATRPGGVIGYVTCSPHLSETVYAVRDVIKRRTDVSLLDAADALRDKGGAAIPGAASNGFVQLWPDVHGTDGMFLALLRKRPAPPA
jgi:16S rRNA (cytosine967-C5)-methyltransferase